MNFARYPMHNEPDMPAVTSSSVQIPLSLQVLLLLNIKEYSFCTFLMKFVFVLVWHYVSILYVGINSLSTFDETIPDVELDKIPDDECKVPFTLVSGVALQDRVQVEIYTQRKTF